MQNGRARFAVPAAIVLVLMAAMSWPSPREPARTPTAVSVQIESAVRAATLRDQQLRVYVHPLRVRTQTKPEHSRVLLVCNQCSFQVQPENRTCCQAVQRELC